MKYRVKIIHAKEEISNKEKDDKLKQFQAAFVAAAIDYYSDKTKQKEY